MNTSIPNPFEAFFPKMEEADITKHMAEMTKIGQKAMEDTIALHQSTWNKTQERHSALMSKSMSTTDPVAAGKLISDEMANMTQEMIAANAKSMDIVKSAQVAMMEAFQDTGTPAKTKKS